MDLLVSSGLDGSRLSFKGYGEDTSETKILLQDAKTMARKRQVFEVK